MYRKHNFPWVLLAYMSLAFVECLILTVIVWAGWQGFGDVAMEYTKKGELCTSVLVMVPPLLLLGVLVFRLMRFHQEKKAAGFYRMECLRCMIGICLGIAVFYLMAGCHFLFPTIMRSLQDRIMHSDWMCYPM